MFSSLAFDAGAGSGLGKSTSFCSFASLSGGGFDHDSVQSRESSVGVPVTTGPSLVLVQSHKPICRGLYSTKAASGVCFCCKEMETCATTSNEETKACPSKSDTMIPTEPRIYYRLASSRGGYIVHAKPYLNVGGLSAVQVAELLDKTIGSFEDWLVEISVHDAMKETGREPEQLRTAIKAISKVSRAPFLESKPIISELASKFEMELELQETEDLDGTPSAGQHLEVSYSSADLVNRLIVDLEGSNVIPMLNILRNVVHRMDLIPDAFTEFTAEMRQALQDLQAGTSLTISALKRSLGTARGEGSTVWGAIDMLQGLVGTLTRNAFRTDIVSSVLTSIPLKKHMLASKQAFSEVVNRFVGLESANTNMGSTLFGANMLSCQTIKEFKIFHLTLS